MGVIIDACINKVLLTISSIYILIAQQRLLSLILILILNISIIRDTLIVTIN